ncbi:MAG: FecR domain-containing protein [Minicystis sp.]
MNPEPCAMAPLVEAARDGRLDERERASVDRHLLGCAACAAFVSELDDARALLRAPVAEPSPLELQRGRMKVLRAAALTPASPPRLPRRWVIAGLTALTALAVLLVVLDPQRSPSPGSVAAPTSSTASPNARTTTTILPEGPAQFTRSTIDETEIVTLSRGTLQLAVRHLARGERFLVKTEDAEVEVRGTVFRVEAIDDRLHLVSVREGKVEVRFHGRVFLVTEGERWDRPPEPSAALPDLTGEASAAPAPSAPLVPASPRLAARPPAPKAKSTIDDGSPQLNEGVALIARGDYGAAAERLEAFEKSHPGDDRAEDAAFLVIVAMQRAGRRAEAAAAAKRYLIRYPAGYRHAEAEAIADAP